MAHQASKDWTTFNASGLSSNRKLLEAFLIDYMALTGAVKVNPSCASCIADYLNKYKMKIMEQKTAIMPFVLNPRYYGLAATPGGNDFVGSNITIELALRMYERRGAKYFTRTPGADTIRGLQLQLSRGKELNVDTALAELEDEATSDTKIETPKTTSSRSRSRKKAKKAQDVEEAQEDSSFLE